MRHGMRPELDSMTMHFIDLVPGQRQPSQGGRARAHGRRVLETEVAVERVASDVTRDHEQRRRQTMPPQDRIGVHELAPEPVVEGQDDRARGQRVPFVPETADQRRERNDLVPRVQDSVDLPLEPIRGDAVGAGRHTFHGTADLVIHEDRDAGARSEAAEQQTPRIERRRDGALHVEEQGLGAGSQGIDHG